MRYLAAAGNPLSAFLSRIYEDKLCIYCKLHAHWLVLLISFSSNHVTIYVSFTKKLSTPNPLDTQMNEDEEKKKWLISKVDYIYQIHLEELKSEKEAATSYSVRYREVINSFERRIFASAAVIATILYYLVT